MISSYDIDLEGRIPHVILVFSFKKSGYHVQSRDDFPPELSSAHICSILRH